MVDVSDLGIELKDMNVPWDNMNVHPDNYDEGEYVTPTTHLVKRLKRIALRPSPFAPINLGLDGNKFLNEDGSIDW